MNTSSQFPALMGAQALPALAKPTKKSGGKLTHPLGKTGAGKHPLAGKCK